MQGRENGLRCRMEEDRVLDVSRGEDEPPRTLTRCFRALAFQDTHTFSKQFMPKWNIRGHLLCGRQTCFLRDVSIHTERPRTGVYSHVVTRISSAFTATDWEAGESATRSAPCRDGALPGIRLTAPSKSQSAPSPPIIGLRSLCRSAELGDTLLFPWQLTFSSPPATVHHPSLRRVRPLCGGPPALRAHFISVHDTYAF